MTKSSLAQYSDQGLARLLREEIDQTRGNKLDKIMAEALARLLERDHTVEYKLHPTKVA